VRHWRALYLGLAELEQAVKEHIHLENHCVRRRRRSLTAARRPAAWPSGSGQPGGHYVAGPRYAHGRRPPAAARRHTLRELAKRLGHTFDDLACSTGR
jgi:hypothetical protein